MLASAALAAAPPAAAASHQAAASSSSGGSSITFKIHYSTTFGEVIKLVGNFEQAGKSALTVLLTLVSVVDHANSMLGSNGSSLTSLLPPLTVYAGNWDVDKAAELKWTQGDTWTTTLSLPAGNKYEYKVSNSVDLEECAVLLLPTSMYTSALDATTQKHAHETQKTDAALVDKMSLELHLVQSMARRTIADEACAITFCTSRSS